MDFKSTLTLQGVAVLTESTGYTQSELSTSGQSSVHFDNVTDVPAFAVLTETEDQVFAGNLVLTGGAGQKYLAIIAANEVDAGIAAYSWGTGAGYLYAGSSAGVGGGIFTNNASSDFADNERANNRISFYRINGTSKQVVFSYAYDSSAVLFEDDIWVEGSSTFQEDVTVNGVLTATGVSIGTHPTHTGYQAVWEGAGDAASKYALMFNSTDTILNSRSGTIYFRGANTTRAYIDGVGFHTDLGVYSDAFHSHSGSSISFKIGGTQEAYLNTTEFGADKLRSLGDVQVDDDLTVNGSAYIGEVLKVRSTGYVFANLGYTGHSQRPYLAGNIYYSGSGNPADGNNWRCEVNSGAYNTEGGLITVGGNSSAGVDIYAAYGTFSAGSAPPAWKWCASFREDGTFFYTYDWYSGSTIASFGGSRYSNQRLRVRTTGDSSAHYPFVVAATDESPLFYIKSLSATSAEGYLRAGSWNYSSDARLKEDIVDLKDQLSTILSLRPRQYRRKNEVDARLETGFVAQEVERVCPELVSTIENASEGLEDEKAIRYTEIIPRLVDAFQQLYQRVVALEGRM
jgi:hypothetical protein